jgi:hypothetical protein
MAILAPPVGNEPAGEDDHVAGLLLALDDDVTEPVVVDPCHRRQRTAPEPRDRWAGGPALRAVNLLTRPRMDLSWAARDSRRAEFGHNVRLSD